MLYHLSLDFVIITALHCLYRHNPVVKESFLLKLVGQEMRLCVAYETPLQGYLDLGYFGEHIERYALIRHTIIRSPNYKAA